MLRNVVSLPEAQGWQNVDKRGESQNIPCRRRSNHEVGLLCECFLAFLVATCSRARGHSASMCQSFVSMFLFAGNFGDEPQHKMQTTKNDYNTSTHLLCETPVYLSGVWLREIPKNNSECWHKASKTPETCLWHYMGRRLVPVPGAHPPRPGAGFKELSP